MTTAAPLFCISVALTFVALPIAEPVFARDVIVKIYEEKSLSCSLPGCPIMTNHLR